MSYKAGFEHFLFLKVLALSIPKGAEHICKDTTRRREWLAKYPHLLTGSMLLTAFAYAEGLLGETWIEDHGKDFETELGSLRIIRNAITHNDGNIRGNLKARGFTGDEQFTYVQKFIDAVQSDEYRGLASWNATNRKDYIHLERVRCGEGRAVLIRTRRCSGQQRVSSCRPDRAR